MKWRCIWLHMHQVLAIINIQLQPLLWLNVSRVLAIFSALVILLVLQDFLKPSMKWRCQLDRIWLHMHQVLAIINIQLHIQASYYDNRGRDEKKQFRGNEGIDSKRWLMPYIVIRPRFPLVLSVSVCGYNPSVCSLGFLIPSMKWRCQRDRLYKSKHLREVVFRVEFVSTLSAPVYFRRCNLSSSSCLILPGICLSSSCLIMPVICLSSSCLILPGIFLL